MHTGIFRQYVRASAATLLCIGALYLVLSRAQPAQAAGLVTNCASDADFTAKLAGGGTVTFNCGSATILLSASQTITAPTTINGGNLITLSGGGLRRLFVVNSGAALTLTNITLRDGYSGPDNGGAIVNHGTLVVQGGRFYSNTTDSGYSGGAVESFGVLNVSNTEFAHNHAGNGGALFPRESASRTSINGSTFYGNFTTNSTNGWGGVALVWNGAQVSIVSSALGTDTANQGGALYLTSLSALTVTNSAITSGLAITGGAVYGAAGSTLMVDHSRIASSIALAGGGGIYNAGTATLQDATSIDNNQAVDGAGLYNTFDASLFDSSLSGNTASGNGGGIYAAQGAFITHMERGAINHNRAANGGGVYDRSSLDLWIVTLSQNAATASEGGAVYVDSAVTANVLNSTLAGNQAALFGGGLSNHGNVLFDHATVEANTAGEGGGIFNNGQLTLSISNVNGNTASDGGGIANSGPAKLNANRVTLSANHAQGDGGAVDNNGTAHFVNGTFSGNRAQLGGALHVGSPTILENVTLSDNSAQQGGALYLDLASALALTNTILANSPTGGNCGGNPINSSKFTFSSDVTCGLPPGNTIKGHDPNGLDPLLDALGNYGGPATGTGNDPLLTHMPKANSPAVDGIVGSVPLFNDERGQNRPALGGYDIGAVERQQNDSDLAPKLYLPLLMR